MKPAPIVAVAFALLGAACSQDRGTSPDSTAAEEPPPPENANIALADMGGAVEELATNFGPGFSGRRLVDGALAPTWKNETGWWIPFKWPVELVISFYEREPAWIEAVTITLPTDTASAPKDIEIWTSMKDPYNEFSRVATATLEAKPGEQRVEFDDVEAKYVKIRVLTGHAPEALELAEVGVIESDKFNYTPLWVRAPLVKHWKGSPREAAQRGLDWLQQAGGDWTRTTGCFGCHVQAQVLMGQAVAHKHGYRVNIRAVRALYEHSRDRGSWGSWWSPPNSATAFGAMGVANAMKMLPDIDDKKYPYVDNGLTGESAKRLTERQLEDGAMPVDEVAPPIVQGQFMTTGNAIVALKDTAARYQNPKFEEAAERGLAWIAANEPVTTQDKIFKIITLMHYGTPDHKRLAWSVVESLAADQQADGGWKENAATPGSNAIATGQALYAFKQAGVSIQGEMFRRGVDFLLKHQTNDPASFDNGSWDAMNTESPKPSRYAQTMWAVIGLAGAYGPEPTGALQIVKQEGDKPPARNLAIVLDVSGSMNQKLGDGTRWKTALAMLEEVVKELPEDLNVGLRVYGHRHSSKSAETCKDTQLVVPIARLDRERIVKAASSLRPRGETPLIHSSLQAVNDLKAAGGGSVILITDGEESCGGDPVAAATDIRNSGVDVTLNIVGFTITGENVANELGTLAGSTGGRYYSAQDGAQLSRAVKLAALHRLPYDILTIGGTIVASGQTSELSRELPPGKYRIRIDGLGQKLEEPLTIAPNETTVISLGVENDRFVLRR
jgi:hypothetical protein